VGILPAERRILRRAFRVALEFRLGETSKPAGGTPTLPEAGSPQRLHENLKCSKCGWCKDRWGISWQITPRVLTDALVAGGAEAKRVFAAMMAMGKIDVARIEAARRG
jgi:hypothetical protein